MPPRSPKKKSPSLLAVVCPTVPPVPVCKSTVTRGTLLPRESRTLPRMLLPLCASAAGAKANKSRSASVVFDKRLRGIAGHLGRSLEKWFGESFKERGGTPSEGDAPPSQSKGLRRGR